MEILMIMESTSSKLVKLIIRMMGIKKPYTSSDLDIKRVRKLNIAEPSRYMYKGCTLEKEKLDSYVFRKLIPNKIKTEKLILYFHGGGYIEGMVKEQWSTIAKIAVESGTKVYVPDYPLAPESTFTQVYSMLDNFYQRVLEEVKSEQIIFLGDSAGGGLLLSFAMWLKETGKDLPFKLIALSPWMDVSMSNPAMDEIEKIDPMLAIPGLKKAGEMYAGGTDTQDYRISPLYGDCTGLPPIHIFAGTHDILYPDQKLFFENATKEDIDIHFYEYPGMVHCWMFMPMKEGWSTRSEIAGLIIGS